MILGMAGGIDDEAEPATPSILIARHQEPTLIVAGSPVTAEPRRPRSFRGSGRRRSRNDDVVRRMTSIERPAILGPAFTFDQLEAMDQFPGLRPGIANGLFGQGSLISDEQLREAERDDRPFAVLFVPGSVLP